MGIEGEFVTRDFDRKWQVLCDIADGIPSKPTKVLRFYCQDAQVELDSFHSLRQSLKPKKWLKPVGQIQAGSMHSWIGYVMRILEWSDGEPIDLDFKEFYGLPFDAWVTRLPEHHHELAGSVVLSWDNENGSTHSDDDTIRVVVDPNDHSLVDYSSFQREGMIDQKYMYLSPQAVHHWRAITGKTASYPTYQKCIDTLKLTLKKAEISGLTQPVILGAGAPEKEELICELALKNSGKSTPRALFLDASFYMLISSFKENESLISSVKFDLYCMDILNTRAWIDYVELTEDQPATFFLLGETVGNLHELDMFQTLKAVMRPGDTMVIGGEFFESQSAIESCIEELVDRYKEPSVIDLVMGHLISSSSPTFESITPKKRRTYVDVVPTLSSDIIECSKLLSDVEGTYSFCFKTNHSIQVGQTLIKPGLFLGSSKRYVLQSFIDTFCKKVMCDHIATVAHPDKKERYHHLIFKKKPPPINS